MDAFNAEATSYRTTSCLFRTIFAKYIVFIWESGKVSFCVYALLTIQISYIAHRLFVWL